MHAKQHFNRHYTGDFEGSGLFTDACPEAAGIREAYSDLGCVGLRSVGVSCWMVWGELVTCLALFLQGFRRKTSRKRFSFLAPHKTEGEGPNWLEDCGDLDF